MTEIVAASFSAALGLGQEAAQALGHWHSCAFQSNVLCQVVTPNMLIWFSLRWGIGSEFWGTILCFVLGTGWQILPGRGSQCLQILLQWIGPKGFGTGFRFADHTSGRE